MAKSDKNMQGELALLNRLYEFLGEGNNARAMELDEDEAAFVKTLDLLSYKPIIYVANVSDEDLVALYNGANCTMFPSRYEGFGFPILESYACGTPVMTCRNSSLEEGKEMK